MSVRYNPASGSEDAVSVDLTEGEGATLISENDNILAQENNQSKKQTGGYDQSFLQLFECTENFNADTFLKLKDEHGFDKCLDAAHVQFNIKAIKLFLNTIRAEDVINDLENESNGVFGEDGDTLLHLILKFSNIAEEKVQMVVDLFAEKKDLLVLNKKFMEPLHTATYHSNYTGLKVLLKKLNPDHYNRRWKGETPLIILIKDKAYLSLFNEEYKRNHIQRKHAVNVKHDKEECLRCLLSDHAFDLKWLNKEVFSKHSNKLNCLQLCLDYKLDVNKTDFDEKSPMHWASLNKYKHFVHLILKNWDKQQVDLHTSKETKSPYKIISEKKLFQKEELEKLPKYTYKPDAVDEIFRKLRQRNIYHVNRILKDKESKKICDEDNQSYTILQLACENGDKSVVENLLKVGADPNKTILQNTKRPIQIAFDIDNAEILNVLLKSENLTVPKLILHDIFRNMMKNNEIVQLKCVEMILKSDKYTGFNEFDDKGYIPLNYVSLNLEIQLMLLSRGATWAARNDHDEMAISYVEHETLEQNLNSCINVVNDNGNNEDCLKKSKVVSFDFKSLLPPENKNNPTNSTGAEMDVISYIMKTPKLKPLLEHPLITAFLLIKWELMRSLFFGHLLLYLVFCTFQFLFIYDHAINNASGFNFVAACLMIATITLALKELVEIYLLGENYIFASFKTRGKQRSFVNVDWENVLELLLICSTTVMWIILQIGNVEMATEVRICLFIFVIFLTAVCLLSALEKIPLLSNKVAMLVKVTKNVFYTFIVYSTVLVPFALSFAILYKKIDDDKREDFPMNATLNNITNCCCCNDSLQPSMFNNMYLSVIKTVVMMTGEFEVKDTIDFQNYPIASGALFLLFIFFVAIICFNLLIGLAVSDIQNIVKKAKMLGLELRTKHICYYESILKSLSKYECEWLKTYVNKFSVYFNKYHTNVLFKLNESDHPKSNLNSNSSEGKVPDIWNNLFHVKLKKDIRIRTKEMIENRKLTAKKEVKKKIKILESDLKEMTDDCKETKQKLEKREEEIKKKDILINDLQERCVQSLLADS